MGEKQNLLNIHLMRHGILGMFQLLPFGTVSCCVEPWTKQLWDQDPKKTSFISSCVTLGENMLLMLCLDQLESAQHISVSYIKKMLVNITVIMTIVSFINIPQECITSVSPWHFLVSCNTILLSLTGSSQVLNNKVLNILCCSQSWIFNWHWGCHTR